MAVVDYFLKMDGVEGESTDEKHKNEIQVESFSFGATQTGTFAHGSGGGAGKVQMQDFHFTQKVNKASPKLALACATGQHIKKAVLTARKAGGTQQDFYIVTFTDLLVSSYQVSGSGHGDTIPIDQISLNFAKIEWQYQMQSDTGNVGNPVRAGYDLKQNKKL
jgi:type VI secretion system secreted protein Hcp